MIQNISDYKKYRYMDDARYKKSKHPFLLWLMGGDENSCMRSYMRTLRRLEYYTNVDRSLLGRVIRAYLTYKHRRNCMKYAVFVRPNSCGPGLRIVHIGGIHLNCESLGANCTVTQGVVLGNKNLPENRPVVGDDVELTLGCKVIGKITIGNNVIVAPNSVVVKDVHDNSIVSGILAKFIKYNGKKVSP